MMEEKRWYEGVPAPVDRDGNVVPLTTRTLYDVEGHEHEVKEIILIHSGISGDFMWIAKQSDSEVLVPELLYLERPDTPDTWERVEADLAAMARTDSACYYFGAGADLSCEECPAKDCTESCFVEAARDVLRRCRAIAGVA